MLPVVIAQGFCRDGRLESGVFIRKIDEFECHDMVPDRCELVVGWFDNPTGQRCNGCIAADRANEKNDRALFIPRLARQKPSTEDRREAGMARKFFGTDGIRGRTNEGAMTPTMAMKVGQAAGIHFLRGGHRHRVVIGKDTRLSGYMMESALVAGLHQRRHGRGDDRSAADPRHRHADPRDARRSWRDDIREPQSVRG